MEVTTASSCPHVLLEAGLSLEDSLRCLPSEEGSHLLWF